MGKECMNYVPHRAQNFPTRHITHLFCPKIPNSLDMFKSCFEKLLCMPTRDTATYQRKQNQNNNNVQKKLRNEKA